MKIVVLPLDQLMPISTLCYKFSFSSTFSVIREDSKKRTVKRVTSSLKVGRQETKNHILFEEKNSDMEGRYKNKLCQEMYGFLEKWFLNEVNV